MKQTIIKKTLQTASIFSTLIVIASCANNPLSLQQSKLQDKWINPEPDEGVLFNYQSKDFDLYTTFKAINGDVLPADNCYDLEFINQHQLKDPAYNDWRKFNATCKAVKPHFNAPEQAKSYWPDTFAEINLATFPATALAYTGKESLTALDINQLLIIDTNQQNVKIINDNTQTVNSESLETKYTLLARGDFNYDGSEDLFIRLDWALTDDNFEDTDWIVITKRSANVTPYLLWRDQ